MIDAKEKEFWFRVLVQEIFYHHTHMYYCAPDQKDLDTSRVHSFQMSVNKLVGFCIPFQYDVSIQDLKEKGIIKIMSHSGRVLRTYTIEDTPEDL